jgi:hypothetical protein
MSMTLEDFEKAHGLDEPKNPRAVAGNNNPPAGAIERSKDTLADLQQFLKDEPVICDEDKARYAKGLMERAKSSIYDMERERTEQVTPLNEAVKRINDNYRGHTGILGTAAASVRARLNSFVNEQRRKAEEEARKAAEEAERKIQEANDAIKAKAEAAENADLGEVGIDVVAAEQEAAQKVAEANRAIRVANRAERDTNIRVGGGFGRVMTQRTKETLIVTDWQKAITEMGFVDGIRDAVLTAGRAYRKLKGDLPEGIVSEKEKSL